MVSEQTKELIKKDRLQTKDTIETQQTQNTTPPTPTATEDAIFKQEEQVVRNFLGIWIPKELYLNNELSWTEKLLLIEIQSLQGTIGCFASNEYFAKFLDLSIGRIANIITHLKRLNYLLVKTIRNKARYLFVNVLNNQDLKVQFIDNSHQWEIQAVNSQKREFENHKNVNFNSRKRELYIYNNIVNNKEEENKKSLKTSREIQKILNENKIKKKEKNNLEKNNLEKINQNISTQNISKENNLLILNNSNNNLENSIYDLEELSKINQLETLKKIKDLIILNRNNLTFLKVKECLIKEFSNKIWFDKLYLVKEILNNLELDNKLEIEVDNELETNTSQINNSTAISPNKPVSNSTNSNKNLIILGCATGFVKDYISQHFLNGVKDYYNNNWLRKGLYEFYNDFIPNSNIILVNLKNVSQEVLKLVLKPNTENELKNKSKEFNLQLEFNLTTESNSLVESNLSTETNQIDNGVNNEQIK